MAFGTIQDNRGEIDLVFFARTWENCKALVAVDEMLALKGTIDPRKDKNPLKPGFVVSSIQDLNRLVRLAAKKAEFVEAGGIAAPSGESPCSEIHIRITAAAAADEGSLYSLLDCIRQNPGACQVYIHVPVSGGISSEGTSAEKIIRAADHIAPGVSESMGALAAVDLVWNK